MSTWTDGWEDNDVEFEDDESSIEEDFDKKEDSQGLKLGSGMFMGRLANLVNSVADENQANGEGKKKLEEELEPKVTIMSHITSILSSSLVVEEEDGWDDQELDDIGEEEGWEKDGYLDEIEVEQSDQLKGINETDSVKKKDGGIENKSHDEGRYTETDIVNKGPERKATQNNDTSLKFSSSHILSNVEEEKEKLSGWGDETDCLTFDDGNEDTINNMSNYVSMDTHDSFHAEAILSTPPSLPRIKKKVAQGKKAQEKNPILMDVAKSPEDKESVKIVGVLTPIAANVAPDWLKNGNGEINKTIDLEMISMEDNSQSQKEKLDLTLLSQEEAQSGWDDHATFEDFDLSTTSTQEATNAGEEIKDHSDGENSTSANQNQDEGGWDQDDIDLEEGFSSELEQRKEQATASMINVHKQLQPPRTNNISTIHEAIPVLPENAMLVEEGKENGQDIRLDNTNASNCQPTPQQQTVDESLLVDQVPPEAPPPVLQRDSTIAMGSDRSGTLGEETLDEQHFGPVVDHLPPPNRLASDHALSVAAQARYEDLDQDSKEVGEDTEPGQTSEENINRNNGAPSVVDHVPTINDRVGILRDSIFAVASQQSSPVMEDIWREDFDPNDEDYGPVVDHLPPTQTPTPSVRSIRSHSSLAVHGAIAEEDENNEDTIEKPKFGIFSGASVADSIAVVAPIAEHEDEENTVEQTVDGTIDGTVDGVADDETVSNAPPTLDATVQNEPLVDHVPLRGEGRPVDNSTLVLVDQSEFSTVGDMTYEDVQYGPVVDHTPPPMSTSWQATAAASVIVAATKSECPDDLEDDIDVETYAMGTGDDGATLETSLGDQNSTDDKLVDHVPELPGMHRVNSSSAIAEAQSVMSTRDDEFGLVVDLTPIPPIGSTPLTRDSVGALAPLSEGETLRSDEITSLPGSSVGQRVEVDKVPIPSTRSRADSIFTVKSVSVSDVDTLDGMPALDEFGPVVDHLPPARSSLTLSRGGSTTGALATLSESNFDGGTADAEVNGWEEDDQELQDVITTLKEEEVKQDTPETRNKSVTFQSLEDAPVLPLMSEDIFELQNLPRSRSAIVNRTGERDVNSKLDTKLKCAKNSSISHELLGCPACSEATSLDCPCIQRILAIPGDENIAVSKRITPDGFSVFIDFEKLLQDEVTKRLLLEKEIGMYEAQVKSLHVSVTKAKNQNVRDRSEIDRLEKSSAEISIRFKCEREESTILKRKIDELESQTIDKNKLSSQIMNLEEDNKLLAEDLSIERDKLLTLEIKNESLISSEINLKTEVHKLKEKCQRKENLSLEQREKGEALTCELTKLQDEHNKSLEEFEKSKDKVQSLKHEKSSVERKLKVADEKKSGASQMASIWKVKESRYNEEIDSLKQKVSNEVSTKKKENHLRETIESLQEKLYSRSSEVESLQHVAQEKTKLEQSQLLQTEHITFLESKAAQLDDEIRLCKEEHMKEIEDYAMKETVIQNELSEVFLALGTISEEKLELEGHCNTLEEVVTKHEHSLKILSDTKVEQKAMQETISLYSLEIEKLKNEIALLIAKEENYNDMVVKDASTDKNKTTQIELVAKYEEETRTLKQELEQVNSKMKDLQAQVMESSSQRELVETLNVKLDENRKVLESKNQELVDLQSNLDSTSIQTEQITTERNQLLDLHDHLRDTINLTEKEKDEAKKSIVQIIGQLELANERHEALLEQLRIRDNVESKMRSDIKNLLEERVSLFHEKEQMESDGEEMLVQLGLNKEQMDAKEREIFDLHGALRSREEANILIGDDLRDTQDEIQRMKETNHEVKVHQKEELKLYREKLGAKEREMGALCDALRSSETKNVRTTDSLRDAQERSQQLEKMETETKGKQQESNFQLGVETQNLLHSMKQLTVENADLKQQVDDLTSAKVFNEEELKELKAERYTPQKQRNNVESDARVVDTEEKELKLLHITHVDKSCLDQEKQINYLTESLRKAEELAQVSLNDAMKLIKRAQSLEEKLAEKEDIIERSCKQSEESRSLALTEMSQTIDDLSEQLSKSEKLFCQKEIELRNMEANHAIAEEELKTTKLKLFSAEEALFRRQVNNKEESNDNISKSEYERLLAEAKETIFAREQSLQSIQSNFVDLEMRFSSLMELQQEKKKDKCNEKNKEECKINIEKNKVKSLDQQLSTMLVELSTAKNLLSCKEEELERVSLELEETRTEQLEVTQRVATQVLESDLSKEEAEKVDNMRGLIISLSQALEKSETRRADAIERLLRERKTNADSLKRLGESVKRFYVTLNATTPQKMNSC